MPYKNKNTSHEFSVFCSDILNGEEFKIIFNLYHDKLLHIARNYVSQQEDAEEIVQDIFIKLWNKRKNLKIDSNNISGYLFVMVRNGCLDHLRKRNKRLSLYGHDEPIEDFLNFSALSDEQASGIIAEELREQIEKAIDLLPEKCRMVFLKSRQENLTYGAISDQLHISVKTVENQIGKALKHMRFHLQEYLHLFL